jgi:hypothetical protein
LIKLGLGHVGPLALIENRERIKGMIRNLPAGPLGLARGFMALPDAK